jgi:hypothetical protein
LGADAGAAGEDGVAHGSEQARRRAGAVDPGKLLLERLLDA